MLHFGSDKQISKIVDLVDELFANVLYDEEPLFISDEATLWSVASGNVNEILERCRKYYGVTITLEETQENMLWELLLLVRQRKQCR